MPEHIPQSSSAVVSYSFVQLQCQVLLHCVILKKKRKERTFINIEILPVRASYWSNTSLGYVNDAFRCICLPAEKPSGVGTVRCGSDVPCGTVTCEPLCLHLLPCFPLTHKQLQQRRNLGKRILVRWKMVRRSNDQILLTKLMFSLHF